MRKRPRSQSDRPVKPGFGESEIIVHGDGRVSVFRVTAGLAALAKALAEGGTASEEGHDAEQAG